MGKPPRTSSRTWPSKDLKSALGAATSLLGSGAGLLLSFGVKTVLNLDTAKLNGILAKYTGILDGLTTRMTAREGPLDKAYRSALEFEAGVARAQGFGTRALEEFKDSKVCLKVDSNGNYNLNLAANEHVANGILWTSTSERRTSSWHSACVTSNQAARQRPGPTASRCPAAPPPSRTTSAPRN